MTGDSLQKHLHRVGLCVRQTGTTAAAHWTEAESVCVFVLKIYTAALEYGAKSVSQRRRRSWYGLVNKVRVWLATWQSRLLLCFYHRTEGGASECVKELLP